MGNNLQLLNYSKYNLWANDLMTEWLCSKDPLLMTKEVKSSFTTINDTLSHIWFGEHIWMKRIQGLEFENIYKLVKNKNTSFITSGLLSQSQEYITLLEKIDTKDLHKGITYYQSTIEKDETTSIENIVHHIMNHSTYHRGQLVTMGRELDFTDPPKTDFIQYTREA